ncbi:YbaB/EbfC family nucleoid-associated protein [Actinokineospora xionganensis]|uniref:YbaB/EbfC family nucleoid-associated protein n=1 Tax=Actinokineospora xionganensis TaxID=2684470 RepID=A0ABR7L719_9PSEU|nr:YbaB/EbfC family nucleoid-associated protein [Actinokineospora xionganensis]MBC6448496.1 YbaB/EbfC family nucleoid-associated protein [Actinokineospora xionganensis]
MEIDIDHELDTVVRRVEQTEQRAQRIGPVTGQAASGDGAITVEVRPGGLLSEVKLTPAALSSGSDALAAQIMALAERATRRAGANMHAALAPVLGPDGEKHLRSLGYEPDDEDDDEAFDTPLGHQQRRRVR